MSKTSNPSIDKLINNPLQFDLEDYMELYQDISEDKLKPSVLRETTLRILDLAEEGIYKSDADKGITGYANKRSRAIRQERFRRLIKKDFTEKKENILILAEGDSWFEHPLILDILDHLELHDNVAIYSLAYGADWLDNIIYQGEYVDQLSLLKPHVFLVSGGGNDIIEGGKINLFLRSERVRSHSKVCRLEDVIARFPKVEEWPESTKKVLEHVNTEFYSFLHIMLFQYYYMFKSIRRKYLTMPIFTQGYDYAIPHSEIDRNWFSLYQRSINCFMDSGKWIENVLKLSGHIRKDERAEVVRAMLGLFNEGLIELAEKSDIKDLYHIDSRGLSDSKGWFDEIHVKGKKYMQIAETYHYAIEQVHLHGIKEQKVFKSSEIWKTKSQPGFGHFIKGFRRVAPTFKKLFLQLIIAFLGLLLWWMLIPSGLFNIWGTSNNLCKSYDLWQFIKKSNKLPLTIVILGFPLTNYFLRMVRAIYLSWYYSMK